MPIEIPHFDRQALRRRAMRALAAALALAVATVLAPVFTASAAAATAYGLTSANQIVVFDTAAPGTIGATLTVTGLEAGETLVGIDLRPATGQLYALGSTGRLYIINTASGAAQPVGTEPIALSGAAFGIDFNPAVDLLRVVSDTELNVRVNPNTGALAGSDTPLAPAGTVVGAAYANNYAGAAATTLFAIDAESDELVLIGGPNGSPSPNGGAVSAVGALGVDTSELAGLDIAANTGVAYAVLTTGGTSGLYTVDLTTGAATLVGALGGGTTLRGLAVLSRATTLYGLTSAQQIVKFHSAVPGVVLQTVAITGLQSGETIVGIDVRPATGILYGVGSTSRLYRLDAVTGRAEAVSATAFTTALSGTEFGVDFSPTGDRLRVISDTGQNLRINPDTGAVAATDPAISPGGTVVTAAAHTNNVDGATSTTLFAIDSTADTLVRIGGVGGTPSPNGGVATTIGALGVDTTASNGFDVSPLDNIGFAALNVAAASRLYVIDLGTGSATEIAPVGGSVTLRGLAVDPTDAHFAEGSTGTFFDTDLLLANPTPTPAPVTVAFLTEDGTVITTSQTVAAQSRATILADQVPGLEATAFSSVVTSHLGLPVIAERTMRWDGTGYGSHTEKAAESPARTWYFAEGSQGFFDTFFLFTNPAPVANAVTLQFLLESGATVTRTYGIGPQARLTVHAGGIDELVNQSFGTVASFAIAGVAERAMYFGTPVFNAGHESAGVRTLSREWFLAEGATGEFFTTFVLLANPGSAPATVTLTYLREGGGEITRTKTIPAQARLTINIATEDASLEATSVATRVSSDVPIVVERAQYWPFLPPAWQEAHNSFGVTQTATRWGLAEGRVGGPNGYLTYVLLANPESTAANVTLVFLRTGGGSPVTKTVSVPANARLTVSTGAGTLVPELTDEEFSVVITSDAPIFVERAMYNNANDIFWAAGSNATATAIP